MSDPLATTPAAAANDARTTSRWEDYIDVFFSPSELFARRARDRVAPPLITLLLLAVAFYFIMIPANIMAMRASVAGNEQALAAMEQYGMAMQAFGVIMIPVTYLVIIAFTAAVLWLAGRFLDVRTDYSRTMLIATYAAFVYLLAQIAGGIAVLIQGDIGLDIVRHTSFGALRFFGDRDMNRVVMALLRRIDVFVIWQAVLWGIGLRIIYDLRRSHAAAIAAAAWLLYVMPAVILGALGIGAGPSQG
jgi:hypothetical protein